MRWVWLNSISQRETDRQTNRDRERDRETERQRAFLGPFSTWPWWVVAVTGDFSLMMKGRTPRSVIEDKVHPLSLDKTLNPKPTL